MIYHTELAEKVYTFAETLVQLCVVEMATCELGEHSKKLLVTVHLHNNDVKCNIQHLSAGMGKKLCCDLIQLCFSL
jgi:hypothetical protein